jgi:hypothetical protein
MSASHEWTEWHLTPRGWEEGSTLVDFGRITQKPPPLDRVLTCKYTVKLSSPFSRFDTTTRIEWKSDNQHIIEELIAQFGECPEQL